MSIERYSLTYLRRIRVMAEQVYIGEDDLADLGNMRDIQIKQPFLNEAKAKREKLQLLGIKLTNEPRGNGMEDAKGVFFTSTFEVMGGDNQGREFTVVTNADRRIAQGSQKSQYSSAAKP